MRFSRSSFCFEWPAALCLMCVLTVVLTSLAFAIPDEEIPEQVPPGRVVDAQGKPVAGATIEIHPYRRQREEPLAKAQTDKSGEFVYPAETPTEGHFYVDVHADGFLSHSWIGNRTVFLRRNGKRQPDTFTLRRPVTVSGTILDAAGKPFPNAEISVDYFIDGGKACINCIRVKSDQQGRFSAEEVIPGNLFIRYEEQGNRRPVGVQPAKMVIAPFDASNEKDIKDVVLDLRECRCVLQGQIVDEHGKGVEGRWISATLAAASGRLDESVSVETDEEGRFRFEGLQNAEYNVGTFTPGHSVSRKLRSDRPTNVELYTYLRGRDPPKDRKTKLFWSEPDANGISAALQILPEQQAYRFGEFVNVQVLVRNMGRKKRLFTHSSSQNTDLLILDEKGKAIQHINYTRFTGIAVHKKHMIGPGQDATVSGFRIELLDETQKKSDTPRGGATFSVRSTRGKPVRLQADLSRDLFQNKPKDESSAQSPLKTGVTTVFVTERRPTKH